MCPNEYYSLLDLAAQCSSRWKEFMVWVSMTCMRYLFSKADDMSNVDVLELFPTTWAKDAMDPTRYGLLDNTKAARLFPRYVYHNGNPDFAQFNIDWSRVTHYDLNETCEETETFLNLLRFSPLLESCKFHMYCGSRLTPNRPVPFVVHQNLRHLSFTAFLDNNTSSIFATTTLPSLTHLVIDVISNSSANPYDGPEFSEVMAKFSQRSSHPLRKLEFKLAYFASTFTEVDPILKCLSLINHLCISTRGSWCRLDLLFLRLTHKWTSDDSNNGSAPFLPSLQTLEFHIIDAGRSYIFPWHYTFDMFGSLSPTMNTNDPARRPLKT